MVTDQGLRHQLPAEHPLLEVLVLHPRDVPGADEGGADRLFVVAGPMSGHASGPASGDGPVEVGRSAEPATVSAICRESDLPVRALLRLNDGFTTTGGELTRLVGLAEDYLAMGAEGVAFGYLDADLNVDLDVCRHLADALAGVPWTFHQAVDASLETDRAWRDLRRLPGLDAVLSAGSVRGLAAGHEELTARAAADPDVSRLLLAGGGLLAEHVPWLVRAGVRQFHVDASVRPGGSWKAHVDAGHVRSWRMLLDDATDRAAGRPVG